MRLPVQTKAIAQSTYNSNAVSTGANVPLIVALLPLVTSGIVSAFK